MSNARCLMGLVPLLISGSAVAADLPLGDPVQGRTNANRPAVYDFAAEEAGILFVAVRGNEDVVLKVLNSFGRPVEGGVIDNDVGGDRGAEQGAVVIGRPGEYTVRVEPYGFGDVSFVLGARWLPMEAVARDPDPHGSPADAIALEPGKDQEERFDPNSGDREDWYRFEAKSDGILNVATRSEFGDLILERYEKDSYADFVERSDNDIGGDRGRESITIDVKEGEVYYFRVTSYSDDAEYTIRAVLITDN